MFRKQALDQLNAPEDLERQVALVAPGTVIAASAVMALTVVALAWSILGRVDVTVIARGVVVADNAFDLRIAAPVAGRVSARHVDVGDQVAPGDLLVTFDVTEIDRAIAARKARAALLALNLENLSAAAQRPAAPSNAPVSQDVETLLALLRSQRQDLKVRLELERAEVEAELERLMADRAAARMVSAERGGSVVRVMSAPGDYVARGAPLLTIAGGEGPLSASALLNRNDAGSVRPGMTAFVRPAGTARNGRSTLKGRVVAIADHLVISSALSASQGGDIAMRSDAGAAVILAKIAFDDPPQGTDDAAGAQHATGRLRPEETLDITIVVDERAPIEIVFPNLATAGRP
ncbi:MAG: HlyD family efflux transporter periplasmic adaptor subunit [Pseudomonadota bacterium]